ncbi:hypothetical protein [Pajaroellobacter abortibovis]|uniref:Uncharacterized protein n=1 Tax=Pajaroellobacter abortibovis TaxID=1882918 RepID=A0A1L6MXH3_9BACT|nr:hypothetical protein [Pajaroellobacter abortibovis]APS00179.1 hypothetical protein BCY86_05410 [Pajaroellobacter abortibovis]
MPVAAVATTSQTYNHGVQLRTPYSAKHVAFSISHSKGKGINKHLIVSPSDALRPKKQLTIAAKQKYSSALESQGARLSGV